MQNQLSDYEYNANLFKKTLKQLENYFVLPQEVRVVIHRQAESLEYAKLICDHLHSRYVLDGYTRKSRNWKEDFSGFKGTAEIMQKYSADVYETYVRLDRYERLLLDTNSNNTVGYEPI